MDLDWVPDRLKAKAWRGQAFRYAHEKLDGWHVQAAMQNDGRLALYGRDTLPSMEMARRFPALAATRWYDSLLRKMPPRTCISGELVVPGGRASDVPSGLRGDVPLELVAFAVPFHDGVSQTYEYLGAVEHQCVEMGVPFASWTTCEMFVAGKSPDLDMREALLTLARAKGCEGWVLKNYNYRDWWKLKPTPTVDCVVTGTRPGKGKYVGMVGALVVALRNGDGSLTEVAAVSGMTDDERKKMSPAIVTERICEVAYQYVGSGGRLRHPRFIRWRDDKPAAECTMSQLNP